MQYKKIVFSEWLKIRKTKLWLFLISLVGLPVGYGVYIQTQVVMGIYQYEEENTWLMLLMMVLLFYGTIFLPNIVSLITGTLVNFEKQANDWGHLFLAPIKRGDLYVGKWVWMCLLVVATQVFMIGAIIASGNVFQFQHDLPILLFIGVFILGSLGAISLGSFLFYLFLRIPSNRTVFTINLLCSIPVFFIFSNATNSMLPYFYPWALPVIGMTYASSSNAHLIVYIFFCVALTAVFSILSKRHLKQFEGVPS